MCRLPCNIARNMFVSWRRMESGSRRALFFHGCPMDGFTDMFRLFALGFPLYGVIPQKCEDVYSK